MLFLHSQAWFKAKNWRPFDFQLQCWEAVAIGKSGLLNAPTGFGKTYALFLPLLESLSRQPEQARTPGLKMLWITPLRALTTDLALAMQDAAAGFGLSLRIETKTGDTVAAVRQKQRIALPDVLLTTPESLHLLLSTPDWESKLNHLSYFVVDEWHEMLGNKRGVMLELALALIKTKLPSLRIWGISATIGNLEEAMQVLLAAQWKTGLLVQSKHSKSTTITSIIPDNFEKYPWTGHLGLPIVPQLIPLIHKAKTTLIFTNTRAQTELWYQRILEVAPELAGQIALHHGSLSSEIRTWVEDVLHAGKLKAVVCTSSLDLGVDFRPVEQVFQIGSPKSVARFLQRAGRSGHQPGASSHIYFVPTHALELMEAAALQQAVAENTIEARQPLLLPYDVLLQFMMTMACGDGFEPEQLWQLIRRTFAFQSISKTDFDWCIHFLVSGGQSLEAYDEYQKAGMLNGKVLALNRKVVMKHRMSIGTIVSDTNLAVTYVNGGRIGSVEEWFVTSLLPGDVFWFAGKALEFVRIKDLQVQVKKSTRTDGKVPSWMGGRMPLSSSLSAFMRQRCDEAAHHINQGPEMHALQDLLAEQEKRSHLPKTNEILLELLQLNDGNRMLCYPFEGRQVHEGLAALFAYRLGKSTPISFSMAMNDYGFELFSDQAIHMDAATWEQLLTTDNLRNDLLASMNATEMARRQFGEICRVAGLVFHGYPGAPVRTKHLKASSHLLFNVFHEYEADNLLVQQAFEQVLDQQLDEGRLRTALLRMQKQKLIIHQSKTPTPFSFPLLADRLREKISSEQLADRLKKMMPSGS
jgi:ATP-dependent Lhr-like helicase